MKRVTAAIVALIALLSLVAVATGKTTAQSRKTGPTKLTIWVGWSARELGVFKQVVAEYDKSHPDVTVNVVGGINDDKITASIRSGNVPDVVSSFTSANVGNYCSSGGWIDLAPLLSKSHLSASAFPKTSQYYTQYKGKRCALPLLADTFGLYYNTALLKAAGIAAPPKTFEELTADAKKLTKKNPDGSIKILGFNPVLGFYGGNTPDMDTYAPLFGASYTDKSGKSAIAKDPAWSKFLKWQKSLVDWYGWKNLQKFQAGAGDEFSAQNAFERGKIAMQQDGEWRVAFLASEHPELKYGTAPMPTDKPSLYGSGSVNGTIIGIPKGVKHKDQAWALLSYLTFNTHALAMLSNGLRNVPTTTASLHSKEIKPDAHFATFLKIFANKNSKTTPITAVGNQWGTLIQGFVNKWQAGKVSDLGGALKKLDKDIDAQLAQATAGGAP
jgi:multiple sugar transport system substrate-binding protein